MQLHAGRNSIALKIENAFPYAAIEENVAYYFFI